MREVRVERPSIAGSSRLPVSYDEHPVGRERADEVRGEAVVRGVAVGRVAEDQVVRPPVGRERLEDVLLDDARAGDAQLLDVAVDRAAGVAVVLDENRARGPAGERLEPHRPGAGEEVEHGGAVDGPDQVERGLADAVGGRAGVAALRREDPGPAVLPRRSAREGLAEGADASSPKRTDRTSSTCVSAFRTASTARGGLVDRVAVDAGRDRREGRAGAELVGDASDSVAEARSAAGSSSAA